MTGFILHRLDSHPFHPRSMFSAPDQSSPPLPPDVPYQPSPLDWYSFAAGCCGFPLVSLATVAFTIWMAVDCLRKDPDRYLWIWLIIIIFPPLGAIAYFFLRWIPNNDIRPPRFLRKWSSGREIDRLRMAALQIGNAHQHIQLGDALQETRQFAEAADAYKNAIAKEPANLQALWGAAQVDMHFDEYESARDRLKKVLDADPQYKFGDVSFAYGQALAELGRTEDALVHLEGHVRRWPQPEALYTLACLYVEEGRPQQARQHLQAMLLAINGSPRSIARKYGRWKSKGKRLLRQLPPGGS